jgi:hypothetical protein
MRVVERARIVLFAASRETIPEVTAARERSVRGGSLALSSARNFGSVTPATMRIAKERIAEVLQKSVKSFDFQEN